MKKFTLTEEHIKLLRNMYVGWGYCEFGAPEIDPKRPYGNSQVIEDIHRILTGDDDADDNVLEEFEAKYQKLHRETETALQIVLRTGKFEPGVYECDVYRQNWRQVTTSNEDFIVGCWQPIETAPKSPDKTGVTPFILLGYAPDEDGYSLQTHEGFWNNSLQKWVISVDPNWGGVGQPTHWRPLPAPPIDDLTTPN